MPDTPLSDRFGTMANVNQIGFTEFTTDLLTNVANALINVSVTQIRSFSELVKEVSGGLTAFKQKNPVTTAKVDQFLITTFPSADGTDTTIKVDGTYDQALYDQIIEALPGLAPQEGATPVLPAPNGETVTFDQPMVDGIRLEAQHALTRDVEIAFENLENLIRIGYSRIVCQNAHIETGLKFNATARGEAHGGSVKNVNSSSRIGGGINLGFIRFGGGSSNLTVETIDTRTTESWKLDATVTGRVSVDFRTESFDLEKLKITQQQTRQQ